MSLPVPNLDDRTFTALLDAAYKQIRASGGAWTDLSVHDPGVVLLEAFAYLTEIMIYRLNRLPEKAYVAFLNMLGVSRHPPSAASTFITFARTGSQPGAAIAIPAGTRVAAKSGADPEPVVFTTEAGEIPAGEPSARVRAHHYELVEGELIGIGTGQPGQTMRVDRPPIVHNAEGRDLVLGVEVAAGSVEIGIAARECRGKVYEIWQPVGAFTGSSAGAKHYLIDRAAGVITFAPALDVRHPVDREPDLPPGEEATTDRPPAVPADSAPVVLAKVPEAGREVRVWYPTGGGSAGNVARDVLTDLRTPIPGVAVDGNEPGRGGRPLEAVESALLRGPYEFFSRQRAVTARDFEMLATAGTTAVGRARAFTRAEVYQFAQPGQVEVVLVPDVPGLDEADYRLTPQTLHEHENEDLRQRAESDLRARRALGTSVRVSWARYKAVSVSATVVVRPEEDVEAVGRRIRRRLNQTLNPLPSDEDHPGWNFGEPLRVSNVYRLLEHSEPGVRYVSDVRLSVDSAPNEQVRAVAVDNYQPLTCYAGAGELLFRSTNAARGWEEVRRFTDEAVHQIVPAPAAVRPGTVRRPGSLAVVTRPSGEGATGSRVWLSDDLGDSWDMVAQLEPRVNDVAWIDRDGTGSLLLATDVGLFEVALVPDATPLQTLVDPTDADRGFYAVEAFVSEHGIPAVALAAQAQLGTYLSVAEGRSGTFRHIGLSNMDTRTVAVQYDGPATLLWVGVGEADPSKPGQGCYRTRLFEADVAWQPLNAGWIGGTCRWLAFHERIVVAASHSGGVLTMDTTAPTLVWQPVQVNCGLPLRDRARFEPVEGIAVMAGEPAAGTPGGDRAPRPAGGERGVYRSSTHRPIRLLLAGGARGVYRSGDAMRWTPSAGQETTDVVTVPDTWLLCSGEHRIEVTTRDGTEGD